MMSGFHGHPSALHFFVNLGTFHTTVLHHFAGTAWTEVITAQLLGQFLGAVDDPHATLDLGFGREALAALAHRLEKTIRVRGLAGT